MILSTILSFSRAQALTDLNGLTDANGIIFANEALQDFHRRLVNSGVDASQLQEAYTDGTVGVGTYTYPADMLFLKAIECNYQNSTPQDYQTASQIDVSNLAGNNSFSWLRQNGNRMSPQFDDRGDWFEIFPTPTSQDNTSKLFRIFYFLRPTEYASVSDTVAYPENLDTTILGWRIAASYLYSLSNIEEADAFNAKYDERVKQYIATLGRGTQQPIQATVLQMTGWNF